MKIRPIKLEEQKQWVEDEMRANGHGFPSPTHYFEADGQLIGALGLDFAPMLFMWMHTERATALQSYRAHAAAVQILRDTGHFRILTAIQPCSPFYSFVDRLGYRKLCDCQLFGLQLSHV